MKKPYKKTECSLCALFSLHQYCDELRQGGYFSKGACGYEYTDVLTIFMGAMQGGTVIDTKNKYGDLVCYHNPSDGNRLFNF